MKAIIPDISELSGKVSLRQMLLICGILSIELYVGTDVLAAILWNDYSYTSQTVSELIAIDSPTRPFVIPFFVAYAVLVYAFGVGVWLSAGGKQVLRLTAIGMVGKEVLGLLVTLFFPIHLRGIEGTLTDTMHAILTGVGVFFFMFPAMLFGAWGFGKKFKIYSIVTMVVFLICGVLTGIEAPKLVANQPTPWIGILERVNIYGYFLWVVMLTVKLLHTVKDNNSIFININNNRIQL